MVISDLKDYIRARGPTSPKMLQLQDLRRFALETALGMCHLVDRGIVHRDLACRYKLQFLFFFLCLFVFVSIMFLFSFYFFPLFPFQ